MSVIEITSSADENEEENSLDGESSHSTSPELLKSAQGQIDVVFNGKASSTLSNSNLDLNMSFDEFIDHLNNCISKKTRQSLEIIQGARKIYRYIWMTKARSQQKTLPRYTDFDEEEHYQTLQKEVRTMTKKNRELDDMILRFHVDVRVKGDNEEGDEQEHEDKEPSSPS